MGTETSVPACAPAGKPGRAGEPGPLLRVWRFLRELSGDDAYERYLAHHATEHPEQAPLDRRQYFDGAVRQRWSGVNRCC